MNTFIDKSAKVLSKVRFLDVYMSGHEGFIAGGCFKQIFSGHKIKDIDIFFHNEKDHAAASVYFKGNEEYVFSYENDNVIAYKNKKTEIRVELVRSYFGSVSEMLEKFDFSITKFAYYKKVTKDEETGDKSTEYLCKFHVDYFEHLVCKKLVLEQNVLFPVSTWERSLRYVKYGYGLCRESKQNLLISLKDADVSDLSNSLYNGID